MAGTDLTFTIVARRPHLRDQCAFTIVELMIATALSAVVFAAIFSAYLFIARNLTRLAYTQQQMVESRDALYRLGKDVREATGFSTATDTTLDLVLSSGIVRYVYAAGTGTLTRSFPYPGGTPTILVHNITGQDPLPKITGDTFSYTFFTYYSKTGTSPILSAPGAIVNPNFFVGKVEMRYISGLGRSGDSTRSSISVVSSRMILSGKTPVGQ